MQILLTGPEGQIGWELHRALVARHNVVALRSCELDLADARAIRRAVRRVEPNLVVNAAGFTNVDGAESEPERAFAINERAVGALGAEAARLGAVVIHFSTDYVFDGTASRPYRPDDRPNPLSVYGRSKLAGERALAESGAAHLIIRTSWVYSGRRPNFVRAILQQAAIKPHLRIVDDQEGCPTWCRPLAQAIEGIIDGLGAEGGPKAALGGLCGTYHLAGAGSTTWYLFARRILELARQRPPALVPIASDELAAPARRPAYSALDCTKAAQVFNVLLPPWDQSLREFFDAEREVLLPAHAVSGGAP